MKIIFFWSGIFLGVFFSGNAFACSCSPGPLATRIKSASEIFVGKSLKTVVLEKDAPLTRLRTTFFVRKSWKSKNINIIEVETNDAPCGYSFSLNTEYLVFAYKNKNGMLTTADCQGAGKLEWDPIKKEIDLLDKIIPKK